MKITPIFFLLLFLSASCTQTIYLVRHAEKASAENTSDMMDKDPPLTVQGKERTEALREILKTKKIGHVFSTNTVRTKATAAPVSTYFSLETEIYAARPDSSFIARLRSLQKNALVVGHSNTLDDIINQLCGSVKIATTLKETEYDNLFIVKRKKSKMIFTKRKYGTATP
ncbi:MAG: SixA phosphatase family protein [Chitinophagaceae bacterium]